MGKKRNPEANWPCVECGKLYMGRVQIEPFSSKNKGKKGIMIKVLESFSFSSIRKYYCNYSYNIIRKLSDIKLKKLKIHIKSAH